MLVLNQVDMLAGANLSAAGLNFAPGPVTVFVGPNNSGKSLVLREIERCVREGGRGTYKVISSVGPRNFSGEELENLIRARQLPPPPGNPPSPPGHRYVRRSDTAGMSRQIAQVAVDDLVIQATNGMPDQARVLAEIVSLYMITLDGQSRFGLTQARESGDMLQAPQNHLAALFQNGETRAELRQAILDAFGLYFVLDPHQHGTLRIRMADRAPVDENEEKNWDQRSAAFHRSATLVEELSDGVKAFTGMLAAVVSDDFRVIFIDEPEAFLHPTLSRKLGRRLTALAAERSANVFVATHSSDFLMGCVEAGNVNVVRLTYKQRVATSRMLPSEALSTMMNTPLLRSTGILSGLFYEGVVVAEDDADRAFYQETARRLTGNNSESVADALFLNAQNKQTINRIIAPLREVGIPAAAVVDLDIIKDRGFNDLLKAASVPESQLTAWNTQRSGIARAFDSAGVDMKKVGIEGLPGSEKESAQNLIDAVSGYGVFIVPVGELERWFKPLALRADYPGKSGWFAWIFELMEKEPEIFTDQRDDIWKFLRDIAQWISNPERRGIPS